MLRQLQHDVWATEKLITYCRTLKKEQLALTAPGTYGTIQRTLAHIVRGDERYLLRLGILPEPTLASDDSASLDEITSHFERAKAAVGKLFGDKDFDPDRVVLDRLRAVPTDPPLELDAWTMVTQFAHHGSDHRAHIGTILGAHGLPTPGLDVWAYAREIGAIREKR